MRITLLLFSSIAFALGQYACAPPTASCHLPTGNWTNKEGRELLFAPDGTVLLLDRFGSQADTVAYTAIIDCKQNPVALDLTPRVATTVGPVRLLLGILEWSSDSSFRLRQEIGNSASERPKVFDAEQTQVFYRK